MSPVVKFIKERISVLSDASRGDYSSNNRELEALGKDIFKDTKEFSSSSMDKKNIVSDSKRVAADVRKVIANYQM